MCQHGAPRVCPFKADAPAFSLSLTPSPTPSPMPSPTPCLTPTPATYMTLATTSGCWARRWRGRQMCTSPQSGARRLCLARASSPTSQGERSYSTTGDGSGLLVPSPLLLPSCFHLLTPTLPYVEYTGQGRFKLRSSGCAVDSFALSILVPLPTASPSWTPPHPHTLSSSPAHRWCPAVRCSFLPSCILEPLMLPTSSPFLTPSPSPPSPSCHQQRMSQLPGSSEPASFRSPAASPS